MTDSSKPKVADTLKTIRIPATKKGMRAIQDAAKDEEMSVGRLVVKLLEEKYGLDILPPELKEAK